MEKSERGDDQVMKSRKDCSKKTTVNCLVIAVTSRMMRLELTLWRDTTLLVMCL